LGIDGADIHHKVYDTYSEGRLRLLGYCLSDRLKVMTDCGTAYMFLTKEDLLRFDYKTGDTEGVVNYALSIAGINFAALFTEREEKIRISFRSKGEFSVNEFSKKYYNGGGHKNAAGGDSFIAMKETIERFEAIVVENKSNIVTE
ncbi:MAG: DHHA1 domain-containing protein, partial [Bacteroidota bacterium]